MSVNEIKPKRLLYHYNKTLKLNLGGLNVVVFACMLVIITAVIPQRLTMVD
jgi:hypothetical protein